MIFSKHKISGDGENIFESSIRIGEVAVKLIMKDISHPNGLCFWKCLEILMVLIIFRERKSVI